MDQSGGKCFRCICTSRIFLLVTPNILDSVHAGKRVIHYGNPPPNPAILTRLGLGEKAPKIKSIALNSLSDQ
jgi:hypothetical protein